MIFEAWISPSLYEDLWSGLFAAGPDQLSPPGQPIRQIKAYALDLPVLHRDLIWLH